MILPKTAGEWLVPMADNEGQSDKLIMRLPPKVLTQIHEACREIEIQFGLQEFRTTDFARAAIHYMLKARKGE